jgi:N utilization substance protein A
VRLAARLTGWDVDILTPEEFNKNLEIMSQTLVSIEGMDEKKVDRLAALGMVSVFDIEEVGAEVLATELEIPEELASKIIEVTSVRAKEVAIQQQKDKEAKERLARENADAATKLLAEGGTAAAGDAAADAILSRGLASGAASGETSGVATAAPAAAPSGDDQASRILGA